MIKIYLHCRHAFRSSHVTHQIFIAKAPADALIFYHNFLNENKIYGAQHCDEHFFLLTPSFPSLLQCFLIHFRFVQIRWLQVLWTRHFFFFPSSSSRTQPREMLTLLRRWRRRWRNMSWRVDSREISQGTHTKKRSNF